MRLTPLLLALALVPTALAAWSSSSTAPQEPSTDRDITGGFMWLEPPPADGTRRLYFDAVYTPVSTLNPLPHYEAVLGVWSDCNRDGIIGDAAGETYLAVVLFDLTVCPPGTRHNDGSTVHELLHVGPGAAYPHIADPAARVWLDKTLPEETYPGPGQKTSADHVFGFVAAAPRWVGIGSVVPEPQHATAYAYVDPNVLAAHGIQTPQGLTGVYGSEVCFGGGAPGNWDCNASNWLTSPEVGHPYYLRDIDCTTSAC